jgi:predicted 2-oxoglutarate/Fe(II)-dependent dioxygenase YbiX
MNARSFKPFTPENVVDIVLQCDCIPPQPATVDEWKNGNLRHCQIAWIAPYASLGLSVVKTLGNINKLWYRFDLDGRPFEPYQYTVYGVGDGYGWHIDCGSLNRRKLSFTLQLSDPADYDGGELEIWTGAEPQVMPKEKGTLIAFPSFMLHRVKPVTRGVRKALVIWASGEPFR